MSTAPFVFGGQTYISPTVVSSVNDTALLPASLPTGNRLVLIGAATGGAPSAPTDFYSPSALQSALGSGDLVDAGLRCFNPSADVAGPSMVTVIRVNPAVQASAVLRDSGGLACINLQSTNYGAATNLVRYSVQTGSIQGFKLTAQLGSVLYSLDNLLQNALSLTGPVGATVSVTATQLSILANTVTYTAPFSQYPTVQSLADFINTIPGCSAAVAPQAANLTTAAGLDGLAASLLPVTVTANQQAIVSWFNTRSQFITASRAPGSVTLPVAVSTSYLSGGSDGTISNTNWANALQAAQGIDAQWIVALSSDPTVHAMVETHVAFMSTQGRSERRGFASGPIGMTDTQAISAAAALNSDRMAQVHLGVYDYDISGVQSGLVLYAPYIHAAMVAAGFAGAGPGVAMTNKALNVQGMERNLQNPTNTDPLISGGVLCSAPNRSGVIKVVQSVSTWLVNAKFNRVEISCGSALDYTARTLRKAVAPFIGGQGSPATLTLILEAAKTALAQLSTPEPNGPGVLVGDANSPPYTGLSVSLSGNAATINVQCSPVIPLNYEGLSIYAVPYSGTVTAS